MKGRLMLFIDRFFEIAAKYPAHIAIETNGDVALSYDDLRQNVMNFAAYLSSQGLDHGDLAAISVPKSAEYITALLACWMIGAPFMPLDQTMPQQRYDYILNEAQPKYIITADDFLAAAQDKNSSFTAPSYAPGSRAYIIFTSGSTGEPKGVIVSHKGIVNCIDAQINAFRFTAQSRALFYLSTNFDASLSDIGTALLSGAALIIETGAAIDNAAQLPQILSARRITHMDIPPSLLRLMQPAQMPATLETIIIGGEVCPIETVKLWAAHFHLVNVYGPTEATICTSMVVPDPQSWQHPFIGQAMPNVDYIVVDATLNILSGTATGELLISGIQLAEGYLNRDALNAQKFIALDGLRFYRSGDLVKRYATGEIEFLGRTDRQVKIHGQLVELEEVETTLSAHPAIARAAALKRNMAGRSVLCAFITCKKGEELTADVLKFWTRARLPEWMIPQYISFLDVMPQTPTGKIDYTPLNDYTLESIASPHSASAFTPLQAQIKELWEKVLKTKVRTAQQNFFTLGGDSLALLELSLESTLKNLSLTTAALAAFPTIEAQANWLSQNTAHHKDDNTDAGAMHVSALNRDIALNAEWQSLIAQAQARPPAPPRMENIFFTGATGFLGARLLYDLLRACPSAQVSVLIRAQDTKQGRERLISALAKHDLSYSESDFQRLNILCGDFSLPHCGLDDATWLNLTLHIDCIFHIGALVNTVAPYTALRPANVNATQEIARLLLTGKRKTLHYASTLSVFVSTDQNTGRVYETDRLTQTQYVYGGYGQSKWAAEKFLLNIPQEASAQHIYRLGLITGDTENGRLAEHDFLKMFIQGLTTLGAVPEGAHEDIALDITPVNYAARAMIDIAVSTQNPQGGIYHIANNKGVSLAMIARALNLKGSAITVLPFAQWQSLMQDKKDGFTSAQAATYLALCRLFADGRYNQHRTMDLFQSTDIIFDTAQAQAVSQTISALHTLDLKTVLGLYVRQII
jgi:amino acid adenylation domain-containing protein/thioester reductase-like protein